MAAVLDALAPYVKKLIVDMAQEEVSVLLGVSSEITKLEDNMEGIKACCRHRRRPFAGVDEDPLKLHTTNSRIHTHTNTEDFGAANPLATF